MCVCLCGVYMGVITFDTIISSALTSDTNGDRYVSTSDICSRKEKR